MTAPNGDVTPQQIASDCRFAAWWVRRGWCTGTMVDVRGGGRVCLLGGIAAAVYGDLPITRRGVDAWYDPNLLTEQMRVRYQAAEDAVEDWLRRHDWLASPWDRPVSEATEWNDMCCPSADKAAEVLESCAADIEQTLGVGHVDACG